MVRVASWLSPKYRAHLYRTKYRTVWLNTGHLATPPMVSLTWPLTRPILYKTVARLVRLVLFGTEAREEGDARKKKEYPSPEVTWFAARCSARNSLVCSKSNFSFYLFTVFFNEVRTMTIREESSTNRDVNGSMLCTDFNFSTSANKKNYANQNNGHF